MGKLYDYVGAVQRYVRASDLEEYKTLGLVSMKSGFVLSLVRPDTPDDPVKVLALKAAAEKVLGLRLE
jgi:hypothetical protein